MDSLPLRIDQYAPKCSTDQPVGSLVARSLLLELALKRAHGLANRGNSARLEHAMCGRDGSAACVVDLHATKREPPHVSPCVSTSQAHARAETRSAPGAAGSTRIGSRMPRCAAGAAMLTVFGMGGR